MFGLFNRYAVVPLALPPIIQRMFSVYPFCFHTVPHSFAQECNATPFSSIASALFAITWGSGVQGTLHDLKLYFNSVRRFARRASSADRPDSSGRAWPGPAERSSGR